MPETKDVGDVDQEKVNPVEEGYRLLKEIGNLPQIAELLKTGHTISLVWNDQLNVVEVLTT